MPEQNVWYFADDIFKYIFLKNVSFHEISMAFYLNNTVDSMVALNQLLGWHWTYELVLKCMNIKFMEAYQACG